MLATLALLALTAALPQDTVLDVAVFEDATFGVALPRPFNDWVFEPATSRGTTTVIFHPRDGSLRDQLWGALVLTTFNRAVPLSQVADQRVLASWQPTLGPSFTLLTRDSITVVGLPAIHLVMGGAIDRAVLDVEEYLIARGGDLILLQFRYPRGLPRDSIAGGYERVMDGLRILGGAAPRVAERPAAPPPAAIVRALAGSPWQASAYDALVRFDAAHARLEVTVRITVRNDGVMPADSVPMALLPPAALDSISAGPLRALPARGAIAWLPLPAPSAPQDETSVTAFFHMNQARLAAGAVGVLVDQAWLPLVQAPVDTLGRARRQGHPRLTLRFDLPDSLRAVAPGRLTSELLAAGRRRMTWALEDANPWSATFAIGPYRTEARAAGRHSVRLWRLERADTVGAARSDSLVALVARALAVYSRMFGPSEASEVALVESDAPRGSGSPGVVLVAAGLAADRDVLLRDLARLWWGGAIRAEGEGAGFLLEGIPGWAAVAARGVLEGDSVRHRLVREAEARTRAAEESGGERPLAGLDPYAVESRELLRAKSIAALEAVRRTIGEARFRAAIRTFAIEQRGRSGTTAVLLALLAPDGDATLRSYLFGR